MFDYKIAYGCWLNDSREKPIVDEDWPSIRIDADTLDSFDRTTAFLHDAGYNYLDVFGLITNHSWTDDIASTVDDTRMAQIRCAIDIAHKNGLKLIYGLGVYSWGFDGIIERNPAVRGTSAQAMCASAPESDRFMQRVIDYLCANFEIDGFHLEAADQGRCECDRCRRYASDIDYYNAINARTARYIRSRWPDKLLLVNTSGYLAWGDRFTQAQLNQVRELGRDIDVFIDVGSHGPFVDASDRPEFIRSFPAAFGSSGGFWIYPPQRWARTRWFIPHHNDTCRALKTLHDMGGKSCELFLSPLNNPAAEITTLCGGLYLNHPDWDAHTILRSAIDTLYHPKDEMQRERLIQIFDGAEALFFACWHPERNRTLPEALSDGVENAFVWSKQHPERAIPGEFFLERLFGVGAGFPCYLTLHFDADGRKKYREGMQSLLRTAHEADSAQPCERTARICECIESVIADIDLADRTCSELGA